MATVPLDFVPPSEPNIVELEIYEAPTAGGSYTLIETVTDIGTYPNYLSRYTTDMATSITDWFAIKWTDDKGAKSELSSPVQGGSSLLIGRVINRVLQRDPTVSEPVVAQEAESVIESFFGGVDPYDPTLETSYTVLQGLTYLVMARTYIVTQITSSSEEDYTAGLVSQKSASGTSSKKDINALLDLANSLLGVNYSFIGLLPELAVAGGLTRAQIDQSRLLLEIE